jgi:tetratricopeptide (TPR) repeat protein
MNRSLLIILPALFLFPVFTRAQEPDAALQVKSLMESCQFSRAISLADVFLQKDSTRTDLQYLKGSAHASLYQYREAASTFKRALQSDSTNIKILDELVNVYRQSGDPERAIETCRKITVFAPDNQYFSLQLANLLFAEQEYGSAAGILRNLYRADSSSYYVAKQLGSCFHEMKQYDTAIYYYRRALKISPFDPFVTGKLINAFIRLDEVAMALYHAQVFLAHDSVNIPILKQSGYCNYLMIDFKTSAKQLLKCTVLGDSSKFTMKYLGLSFYKQEKYDSAAPCFRKAFEADTTDSEVCFYFGVSAYRSLDVDTGLVYIDRTLRLLMPPSQFLSTLYTELAGANTATGRADTAIALLTKALEINPGNNTIRFKIAYQYDFYLRKPYEGLPWYREFLKNENPAAETVSNLPQQVSYTDYAKNRIKEITGKKPK